MSKGSNYYGGFFWVSVISFIVPLFVGYKAFENLKPTTKPIPVVDASGVDNGVWDYLLKSYVTTGLVDYDGMKKDYLFREYVKQLGSCNPDALKTEDDKLALSCNAYNAFVINGVISHKIYDTVDGYEVDGTKFFDLKEHIFAGKTISLNDLEHGMIRPTFKEPRIHVGLVCAARSCPAIRAEAYVGSRVREQLQDQSEQFANNPTYVNYDKESNQLKLSAILDWYGDDWNAQNPNGSYFAWISKLSNDSVVKEAAARIASSQIKKEWNEELEGNEIKLDGGEVVASFIRYNWELNSQADPTKSGEKKKKKGGFGSGGGPSE